MKKIVCANYEEMSAVAAYAVASRIRLKPDSVVGFATGSTPVGTYKRLAEMCSDGFVDFSKITSFNLDEYYPIKRENDQSYIYFMKNNLFNHVNISAERINIPNGECSDPIKECADYDAKLEAIGGTDLQILGIGNNGHIAFVEPAENLPLSTSVVQLTGDTIAANARFFDKPEDVPKQALSMGLKGIFSAKQLLLLISGKGKAAITKKLFDGTLSTSVPASLLNLHPNVTVIVTSDVQ
ncbi:MAG: glucosamine-6-phosphate deaminase [Oscillospiraceae bacterium]|nr:glucosamine-6-phosphate deaminase [Oscillospiraceae bacterium]